MAEKQAQIQMALAEKQARDSAEASEKERKVQLREQYKERMHAWQQVSFPPSSPHSLLRCTSTGGPVWATRALLSAGKAPGQLFTSVQPFPK